MPAWSQTRVTSQTACPICHTVFRVAEASLAGTKGMVQCGVCGMVFDAIQNSVVNDDKPLEKTNEAVIAEPEYHYHLHQPAATIVESDLVEQSVQELVEQPSQLESIISEEISVVIPEESINVEDDTITVDDNLIHEPVEPEVQEISFKPKHSRLYKIGWTVTALLLVLLLAIQFSILYRDKIVAIQPAAKPILSTICTLADCSINLITDPNLIKISNSSFEADPNNPNIILVQIGLENLSNYAIAYPSIALTLTNDADEPVVKRNFLPADYLIATKMNSSGISAHSDLTVKLKISAADVKVSGYKLIVFYH